MRVAYWKTEDCSLNQLVVDLSLSAHLPSRLTWRVRPYCLEPVWLGSRDSGICWAGSLPKQQPESLPLQRSLSLYIYSVYMYIYTLIVVLQETDPTSVLEPTPLQQPVADLGFLNVGKCWRHEDRGATGAEGVWRARGDLPLRRNI